MSDQQLMSYFKFDEADLQANRNGQFTEKQKAWLTEDNKNNKVFCIISGVLLVGVAAGGAVIGVSGDISRHLTGLEVSLALLWSLVFCGLGIRALLPAFTKIKSKIRKVIGPAKIVSKSLETSDSCMVYELRVGSKEFNVDGNIADVVMPGDVYGIYYTEASEKEFLSAELILKAR